MLNVANEDLGDARVHALRGIVNIASCDDNMREMFLKLGLRAALIDVLLKVVKEDLGDARVFALCGIANFAGCAANKRVLFLKTGLIDVLLKVAKEDSGDARVFGFLLCVVLLILLGTLILGGSCSYTLD